LLYPADRLLDPRLTPAPQLAEDDAPFEAVPVTFEVKVGAGKKFVVLIVGELISRISMPHRMQVQQVLVSVIEGAVHIVDVGNFAYAVLFDQVLEHKGVDLGFVDG